jgi:hypothetical protein
MCLYLSFKKILVYNKNTVILQKIAYQNYIKTLLNILQKI